MKKDLDIMWEIQNLEREREKTGSLDDLRQEVKEMKKVKAYLEDKKFRENVLRENVADIQRKASSLEAEMAAVEEKKKKTEEELYGGKTNNPRELEDMRNSLKDLETRISDFSVEIIGSMDEAEDVVQEINVLAGEYRAEAKSFRKKVERMQKEKENRQRQAEEIGKRIKEQEEKLSIEGKAFYASLKNRKAANPLARLQENGKCSGCHLEISSTGLHKLEKSDFSKCEHCGRVLYRPGPNQ